MVRTRRSLFQIFQVARSDAVKRWRLVVRALFHDEPLSCLFCLHVPSVYCTCVHMVGPATDCANGVQRLCTAVIVAIVLVTATVTAMPVPAEMAVLQEIYNTMGGVNWKCTCPWYSQALPDPCGICGEDPVGNGWCGIVCDDSNTHVVSLALGGTGTAGTIPASIAQLTELGCALQVCQHMRAGAPHMTVFVSLRRYLAIQQSSVSGTLPPALLQLQSITQLYLTQNNLSGTLPDSPPWPQSLWYATVAHSKPLSAIWGLLNGRTMEPLVLV